MDLPPLLPDGKKEITSNIIYLEILGLQEKCPKKRASIFQEAL
jgi:hypothetical protein